MISSTQPTTDSTVDLDAGFVPSAGICLGTMKTESETSSDHNRFTLGAWTDTGGSNHMDSIGWMDEDAQATSDVDRYISNAYSIKNYDHDQTVVGQATVAVQGNGIRETWTNTDGTEYAHAWLILGGTPVVTPPGHSGRIDAGQVYQDGTVAGMTAQSGVSVGAVTRSKTIAGQITGAT